MQNKHFLILTQYFPPEMGAPQARLEAMARELIRLGHRVSVVTAAPNYPKGKIYDGYENKFISRENKDGIEIIRTWIFPATGRGVKRLLNYLSFSFSAFFGAIKIKNPDYIFTESPPLFSGITGWLVSKWHRAKLILNISDLWPDSVETLGVVSKSFLTPFYFLEKFLYKNSWVVTGTTRGIVRRIVEDKGVKQGKVCHLPNGADLEILKPRERDQKLLRELALTANSKIFIYTGLLGYAQGLRTVLDAARLIQNPEIIFLFLGEGPEKEKLLQYVNEKALKNVRFLGVKPFSEMLRYYSLAEASIVPLIKADLFKDAVPSKMIVSLACGVPPIFSGEGEAENLLKENQCGWTVPPENPSGLAEKIEEIINNPEDRKNKALMARRTAEKMFSWKEIISQWLARLEQLDIK